MADYRTVTACRLCDSEQLVQALDLGQTPLANELDGTELFPLVVNRCDDCGHHQLSIAVSAARLWGPNYPYQSGTSPVFRKHLEALADEVAALKPGGRVLEIASNDGTLCRMLAKRDFVVRGIDPSGPYDDWLGAPADLVLTNESWPAKFGGPLFDVIIALNVFAHVDDLHSFTAAVKEALAPDGVFIVEVGNLVSVVHQGHFDTIYHEHMSYHSLKPLLSFFEHHGLCIVDAKNVASQGGSVRLYVKHAGAKNRWVFIHSEFQGAAALRSVIDSRAAVLREALNKLFQRDEMVCIYGAPAKLTTLLYATGLESMPFNCVGDDNPRKVGRTTPGNHIPIVSVEEMLDRKPDSILVAAWNFYDDISKRLREKGFKGGIINPMVNAGERSQVSEPNQSVAWCPGCLSRDRGTRMIIVNAYPVPARCTDKWHESGCDCAGTGVLMNEHDAQDRYCSCPAGVERHALENLLSASQPGKGAQ